MNQNPLRWLYRITWICGAVAGLLFLLLAIPTGGPDDDHEIEVAARAAALTAFGWTLTKLLALVAAGSGLLLIGLTPVVTSLQRVLRQQDALTKALKVNEPRPKAVLPEAAPEQARPIAQ